MKTIENYLEKTSSHLFKFTPEKIGKITIGDPYYMKILVEGKEFTIIKFDSSLKVKSRKSYPIKKWESISSAGKKYIESELKNYILFYRGYLGDSYRISTIKHFKSFKEVWNKETKGTEIKKVA